MMAQEYTTQTTTTYSLQADDTVSSASILMGKLPNGWKLVSLEHKDGWWIAVCQERREQHKIRE